MALTVAYGVAGASLPVIAGNLTLQWTDNASNESGFKIERSLNGSTFSEIAAVAADTESYVDGGLLPATTYWYRVRAFNAAGDSDYSNPASATTSTNLLDNGSFELFNDGLAVGWATQNAGGVGLNVTADTGRTGQAQNITVTAASSWGMFFYHQPVLNLGQTYVWRFWYKTDGSQVLTASLTNGPHSAVVFDLVLPGTGGTWQQVEKVFAYDNAQATMLRVASTAVGSFWIDDMTLEETEVVTAPTFSPAGGSFTTAQTVTISSASNGASIRYTTDGSAPSATFGTLYSGPVSLATSTTLRAVAFKSGMADSPVTNAAYTIVIPTPNTAPTISSIANRTINEDATTGTIAFTIGDAETPGGNLLVAGSSSNPTLVPNSGIEFGGSGANRTVTVRPAANRSGTANITISVSDGQLTASRSFVVTVNPVNDAPTISSLADRTVSSDGNTGAIPFTVDDLETPLNTLTVVGSSSNPTLVPAGNIVFGGSDGARTVSIAPAAGENGTATITVTVGDGSLSTSASFVLTVEGSNSSPTISSLPNQAIEENSVAGPLAFTVSDSDSSSATLLVTASSSNPSLVPNANIVIAGSGENRTVAVTPAANQTGTATITLTVSDGDLMASTSFSLEVRPEGSTTAEADGIFRNQPLGSKQTGLFTATFAAAPSAAPLDAVIGLGSGNAGGYQDLAAIVRFNRSGFIDARHGDDYKAVETIPYSAHVTYQFRLIVDVTARTYSAYVTAPGETERLIGADLAFRTEQGGVGSLDTWAVQVSASTPGSVTVSDFTAVRAATVATPIFSPIAGTFDGPQTVTFSSATSGAVIRYTTDGSAPTPSVGQLYTAPLAISATTTLRAMAYKVGMNSSGVFTATFTIKPAPAPAPTPIAGPRYFFGHFGSAQNGVFGLVARTDNTGLFLAQVAGHAAPIEVTSFAISETDTFTFAISGLGTVNGQISGGTVAGSIAGTNLNFAGTLENGTGSTQLLAGYYSGAIVNTSGGHTMILAGPDGRALVLNDWNGVVDAALTPIDANGAVAATVSSGRTISLTVNATSGRVTGGVVFEGASYSISGQRDDLPTHERLVNTSVRAQVEQGAGIMIAGFVVSGSGTKQILVRGIGPALEQFGVPGILNDPMLSIHRLGAPANEPPLAQNDDWEVGNDVAALTDASARVYAFPLEPGGKDAALLLNLPAGAYTAHVSGVSNTMGAALVEIYDTDSDSDSPKLANISLRGNVGRGENTVISGFVVTGDVPKRLLIRAVGPELSIFGVPGVLADPGLAIYHRTGGTDREIANNNDWSSDAAIISEVGGKVGAFPLTANSKSAAMVMWLEPGIYTAHATSNDGSRGIALVEVYEAPGM